MRAAFHVASGYASSHPKPSNSGSVKSGRSHVGYTANMAPQSAMKMEKAKTKNLLMSV